MKLKNIIILGTLATATISHAAITAGVNIGNADNANNLLNSRAAGDREAGVGIYRTSTWTDVNVASLGFGWGPLSVTDSGGGTAAQITSTHTSGFNGFSGSFGAMADSADRTLMNGYTSFNSGDAGTITLSGISSDFTGAVGGYTVVVYFESDNNAREASITLGATTINGRDASTFSGTYNEATGVGVDSNYAVFSGLTANSVNIDIDSTPGRMGITGIALYATPEPSSTALLGLGGLALILRRRK